MKDADCVDFLRRALPEVRFDLVVCHHPVLTYFEPALPATYREIAYRPRQAPCA